jgi:hypothetical protein
MCMLFDYVLYSDMFFSPFSQNYTYVHQWKWTTPRVTISVSRLYFVHILACNWLKGNKVPVFSSIKYATLKHLKLLCILSAYFLKIQFIYVYSIHQDTCFVYGTLLWCAITAYSEPVKPILCHIYSQPYYLGFHGLLIYLFVYDFL